MLPLSPPPRKRVAQKFHFAILRIEVTRASRGLSATAELLVRQSYDSVAVHGTRAEHSATEAGVEQLVVTCHTTAWLACFPRNLRHLVRCHSRLLSNSSLKCIDFAHFQSIDQLIDQNFFKVARKWNSDCKVT